MDGCSVEYGCRGAELLDEAFAATHSTAFVGAERDDGLAREVVAFEESIADHGHGAPPVGITKYDGVVLVDAVQWILHFRTSLFPQFFLGFFNAGHVRFGVFVRRVNLEHVGFG